MPRRLTSCLAALVVGALTATGCARSADRAPRTLARATTTTTQPETTTTTASPLPVTSTTAPFDPFALRPPAPATDPTSLADQITRAETAVRDPGASPESRATAALAQQVAYRQLGANPTWDPALQAALPEGLRRTAELNAAARREFRAMHTVVATEMPDWQIVAPAPAATLMSAYQEAEAAFGIPWRFLAAVNLVETQFGRIRGTSTAGAQGPMQFMPATWAAYGGGGDINDVHDAVMGAARYLAANNGAADIDGALYRYNHSNHYVLGVHLYGDLIAEHPGAFEAYYQWGVWYATDHGDLYLPVGYDERVRVPVTDYIARG